MNSSLPLRAMNFFTNPAATALSGRFLFHAVGYGTNASMYFHMYVDKWPFTLTYERFPRH